MTASSPATTRERVWLPVLAPVIWSTHFMLCYVTVALACGRFAVALSTPTRRALVAAYTAVAVAGMGICLVDGLRRHGYRLPVRTHDDDTPEDRRQFMAFTTVLLASLSLLATAFETYALAVVDRCD